MKLNELRKSLTEQLRPVSADDAAFEADCLIADALGCRNAQLPLTPEREIDEMTEQALDKKAERRLAGEPLQYILGEWEFYGLPFFVGKGVLIPRPETEQLVDLVLENLKDKKNPVVLDLCAGSGCIGITIGKKRPDATVSMLEVSDDAVSYQKRNIKRNLVNNAHVIQGDLFTAFPFVSSPFDAIVSNPPYIRTAELAALPREVKQEPAMALDGGEDGLKFYRAIAADYAPLLAEDGFLAVEIGEEQGNAVAEIFRRSFSQVEVFKDYSGLDRMVLAGKHFKKGTCSSGCMGEKDVI